MDEERNTLTEELSVLARLYGLVNVPVFHELCYGDYWFNLFTGVWEKGKIPVNTNYEYDFSALATWASYGFPLPGDRK